ncbi:mannan-binding protein [Sorangium sp. So ce367]|uniref:mannan-binding protein n=1 Tax=Sorangium sp. So ce367 TaxID=3133305 RepID=UPI003F619304
MAVVPRCAGSPARAVAPRSDPAARDGARAGISRVTWNGQWTTTVPGRMSVCGCNPPPPAM